MVQRQHHRGLPAHRMPADIHRRAKVSDDLGQISRHLGVALALRTRAVAVVTHVDRDYVALVGQTFSNHTPVAPRPEKTMHD